MGDSWMWTGFLYELMEDDMEDTYPPGDERTTMDDHIMAEYLKASTSEADVIRMRANDPGMYNVTYRGGGGNGGTGNYYAAGYSGLPSDILGGAMVSNMADNNLRGMHICDYCGNPYNPVMVHDCYEKRNSIRLATSSTYMGKNVVVDPQFDQVLAPDGDPVVWVERLGSNIVSYRFENIPNDQAMRIVLTILPKVMELYLTKSRDYGGNVMALLKLGPKASFVDLWRKVGKLKRCLWDGEPMQGEQTDEILKDCVGHILITLDEMSQS